MEKNMSSLRTVNLTPPHLDTAHIGQKISCIRAHKERIFRVATETIGSQLICHNYGHGGAGWTFLFGCVNESVRQFEHYLTENPHLKGESIAIIGAGCYGLLTAIILTRKGYTVRIVAAESHISSRTPQLPSYNAAGFFFPRPRKCSTSEECALFMRYGVESYATYLEIIAGQHPFITYGPKLLPAYYAPEIDPGFAPYCAAGLIGLPEQVSIDFGTGKKYDVLEYHTVFVNSSVLMEELKRNSEELALRIETAEVEAFSDLKELIVFHCAGLGARKLTDDRRIIPVQGHLIKLKHQPAMQHLQYMINAQIVQMTPQGTSRTELVYYAPKENGILGVTFIRGEDSVTAHEHEFERLLERCQNYFGTN